MKLTSISDVITNSSSEVYIITTSLSPEEFRAKWNDQLEEWGVFEEQYYTPGDPTFLGEIYRKNEHNLVLDYSVLCNLDQDVYKKLVEWFGKDNVLDVSY